MPAWLAALATREEPRMKGRRSSTAAVLAALLVLLVQPVTAGAAATSQHPIRGRCGGASGGGANLFFLPDLAAQFPGANAIGFEAVTRGRAIAFDGVGAHAQVKSDVTFLVTGGDNQEVLWQASPVVVRAGGFAPEEPFPNGDNAFFRDTVVVTMRPVGFSAPNVVLSWPVLTSVLWVFSVINCTFNADIPTIVATQAGKAPGAETMSRRVG